jgi:hypothetical protein
MDTLDEIRKNQPPPRVRISSSSTGRTGEYSGEVRITGLDPAEVATLKAMILGAYYTRVDNSGRLEAVSRHDPLPQATDERMLPFWRKATFEEEAQLQMFDMEAMKDRGELHYPAFMISSLCGYHYTKEGYEQEANKLSSYGFKCLRSQRGEDGRYWEVWYLSSVFSAKGALADKIKPINDPKEQTREAIRFLMRNVSFGSMDMTQQRAAMVAPD